MGVRLAKEVGPSPLREVTSKPRPRTQVWAQIQGRKVGSVLRRHRGVLRMLGLGRCRPCLLGSPVALLSLPQAPVLLTSSLECSQRGTSCTPQDRSPDGAPLS